MKLVFQIGAGIVLGYIGVTLANVFFIVPLAMFLARLR